MDILKRPQKFGTISHLIWNSLGKRQIIWEIVSNFVAFLENLNFNDEGKLHKKLYKNKSGYKDPRILLQKKLNPLVSGMPSISFQVWKVCWLEGKGLKLHSVWENANAIPKTDCAYERFAKCHHDSKLLSNLKSQLNF